MLYFFHHYELPRVELYHQQQQQRNTTTRVPLIVGGHQLVAILHTPIRPFPHISLAVFTSNNNDNRRVDEDVSDNDIDDTATLEDTTDDTTDDTAGVPNSNNSTSESSSNVRNRFYHNSDTLLRRAL